MLRIDKGESIPQHDIIPMPSYGLNKVLGGGLWTGRFSIVWGTAGSGKTSMLLHLLAEGQKKGYTAVIVDTEGSITDEWSAKCGLDVNNRILLRSCVAEEIMKELTPMLKDQDTKYLFLVDSINGISPETFYDKAEGGHAIGIQARARRWFFHKFSEYLNVNNMALIVAQQTTDLSGMYPRIIGKIGQAEWHWASNIIHLFASSAQDSLERDDKSNMIVNREVRWTIEKSKQAPVEGTKGSYWFSPQDATIDYRSEAIDSAVSHGIIQRKSAKSSWFEYDGQSYQGFKNLCNNMPEDAVQEIIKQLDKQELVPERNA